LFDACQTMGGRSASLTSPETLNAIDLDTVDGMRVLHALSDPVRLEIVRQLAGCSGSSASSELKCGQIELSVTKSTASHHLKILYEAGMLASREQGTSKYVRLRRDELDERFPGLLDSVLRATAARRTDEPVLEPSSASSL
jgi:DNA-binding transcriptional ArsR family regulator